jgi:hypothetical protein
MLDGARKALYGYSITLGNTTQRCLAWEQAYHEKNRTYIACAGAYAELYDKHKETVNKLHAMSSQCLSLHRDLEHAQTAMLALESTAQEQERSPDGKYTPDTGEGRGISWDNVEQGIANAQPEARIRELEDEKSKMIQEHENALICVVKREAASLGKARACKNDNEVGSQQSRRLKRSRRVKQEVTPEPCSP